MRNKDTEKFLCIALKYYRGNAIFYFKSRVTTCYHVKKSKCIDIQNVSGFECYTDTNS